MDFYELVCALLIAVLFIACVQSVCIVFIVKFIASVLRKESSDSHDDKR